MKPSILLVEDEEAMATALNTLLSPEYNISTAETGSKAIQLSSSMHIDIVLLDLMLPDISGVEVLKRLRNMEPLPEIIVITAVRDVKTAVEAMKLGAFDYIEKPFDAEELLLTISKVLERQSLSREIGGLRVELADMYAGNSLVGNSSGMQKVHDFIKRVRNLDCNVLILGESGTGKELVARAIHYTGNRQHCPFIAVNCAGLSDSVLESELFGHEKGAFTGAEKKRRGRIELAHTGTLFLDEIGSMPQGMQAKLLRVVELKEFERLGGERTLHSDFRIISASNIDFEKVIQQGEFREDLYYRLNVASITIPPLRERHSDIPLLIEHFLKRYYRRTGREVKGLSKDAIDRLVSYGWPGNVRQLQNVLENALVIEDADILTIKSFLTESKVLEEADEEYRLVRIAKSASFQQTLEEFESMLVREALEECSWDRCKAAKLLGVHPNTVSNKARKYSISKPR